MSALRADGDVKVEVKAGVRAIVLDIEGTTTPIAFVYEVLFPFVRRRLRTYLLESHDSDALREALQRLREEAEADADHGAPGGGASLHRDRIHPEHRHLGRDVHPTSVSHAESSEELEWVATYVPWLMDQDRKSTGLKLLQGLIWQEGYRSGELKGEVFADVAPALRRWRDAGVAVAIYSSGSEFAQRLLFGTTASGDLTSLLSGFFDTTVGAKQAVESYRRIARELETPPDRMLFISDVTAELDAAHSAGCQVLLCVRPGNRPQPDHTYPVIESFDDILGIAKVASLG